MQVCVENVLGVHGLILGRKPKQSTKGFMDPRIREDDETKSPSFMPLPSFLRRQESIPRALKLRGFHQKAHAPHALPFISVQPEGQSHLGRQRLGAAKPDAVHRLALVFELER